MVFLSPNVSSSYGHPAVPDRKITQPVKIHENSLLDIIHKTSQFSKFKKLLYMADLHPLYNNILSKITVFIPSDDAFKELENITVDRNIARHIVKASTINSYLLSDVLEHGRSFYIKAMHDITPILIHNNDAGTFINEISRVKEKNIRGINGVIHVVDKVIIPHFT
jgi:uncharacterized surface protein with fasciclin (FAS1) repeats